MKPAPDPWIELPIAVRDRRPDRQGRGEARRWLVPPPMRRDPIELAFAATWGLVTLPFRLVFGAFSLIGRLTGVAVGFALMVLGAALSAGPLAMVGIPVFLIGLVVSMRSLG